MSNLYSHQITAHEELCLKIYETFIPIMMVGASPKAEQILLDASTGSGKTVILSKIIETVHNKSFFDRNHKAPIDYGDIVWVVLAPNSLHDQISKSLKEHGVNEISGLNVITAEDLVSSEPLSPGTVLVLNWATINKAQNILRMENERGVTLKNILDNTRENGASIIQVNDEAHHTATSLIAREITALIKPVAVLNLTATPTDELRNIVPFNNIVKIPHNDVVKAGIIVKGTVVQDDDMAKYILELEKLEEKGTISAADNTFNNKHVYAAIRKAEKMQEWYRKEGVNIVPLTGIQLPVASGAKEPSLTDVLKDSQDDKEQLQSTLSFVEKVFKWTVGNEIAIWLSENKEGLIGREKLLSDFNSPIKLLFFKYAISLGTDIPRLKTGALLHNTKTRPFAVQTIGRFMRQPERKHYNDERLNYSYIYTDTKLVSEVSKNIPIIEGTKLIKYNERVLNNSTWVQLIQNFELPNHFNKNDNGDYLRSSVLRPALYKAISQITGFPISIDKNNKPLIQDKNKWFKGPMSFLSSLGFEPNVKASKTSTTSLYSDIDKNENMKSSKVFSIELDQPKVEALYRQILEEEFKGLAVDLTIQGFNNALRDLLKLIKSANGTPLSFEIFKNKVVATEINNENIRKIVQETLKQIPEQNKNNIKQRLVTLLDEKWKLPEEILIPANSQVEDTNYLYEGGHPTRVTLDSNAEETFINEIVPKIKTRIEETGYNFIGYCKAGAASTKWLGVPYTDTQTNLRVFYPDWYFLSEKEGKLKIILIETKKQKEGQGIDQQAHNKALGLQNWIKEQQKDGKNIEGYVIDLSYWNEETGGISLLGKESDKNFFIKLQEGLNTNSDYNN